MSKTALIEPVCTREKYQGMTLGKMMLHGIINRLKELGIEKCFVESFGMRKEFYQKAGFTTIDTTVFWSKKINLT